MTWWEATIPTTTRDQRTGVQVFTYPDGDFHVSREVRRQAAIDAISADAIRHRRGAQADLEHIHISSRHTD